MRALAVGLLIGLAAGWAAGRLTAPDRDVPRSAPEASVHTPAPVLEGHAPEKVATEASAPARAEARGLATGLPDVADSLRNGSLAEALAVATNHDHWTDAEVAALTSRAQEARRQRNTSMFSKGSLPRRCRTSRANRRACSDASHGSLRPRPRTRSA